jgi:hypothetical protein
LQPISAKGGNCQKLQRCQAWTNVGSRIVDNDVLLELDLADFGCCKEFAQHGITETCYEPRLYAGKITVANRSRCYKTFQQTWHLDLGLFS